MTVCNMSIEAGARAGLIAPDETTFAYLKGRDFAPKGAQWDAALQYWQSLQSDADANFDRVVELRGEDIEAQVRRRCCRFQRSCPIRRRSPIRRLANLRNEPWSTWV